MSCDEFPALVFMAVRLCTAFGSLFFQAGVKRIGPRWPLPSQFSDPLVYFTNSMYYLFTSSNAYKTLHARAGLGSLLGTLFIPSLYNEFGFNEVRDIAKAGTIPSRNLQSCSGLLPIAEEQVIKARSLCYDAADYYH